ncbi:ABC transporter permease [Tepidibacter formicigenes]|jgi:ABC-type nitrate/sulfonate/bicarbonate transport system permease component|uniref:ABC-type nitrate/sulfonate/bicarbonate transport system, permease component n=1 Tax=Tepidibacter formicigenes DSM 15518 TaxID=1123349 RepID=A0A1M6NAK2_9FIRM|nr:ABC transporter permease [Tepidibacter formicigenes]SHJ92556.1 ABC-type nitrate/sulfonate/bicarbonate transport system, permease component [Tepidibacter formicigenes DSM 15518]
MKKLESIENKIVPIAFFGILVTIWEFVVAKGFIEKYILPSPKDIFITFLEILPNIRVHIFTTIYEAFFGFIIAIIFSLILAVLMDNIKILKKAIYPLLIVSQTIPIVALAPLFVIWFGFGKLPKIIVVVLVCFFPIVISLLDGLDSVDEDTINLLKSMGAGKIQIFKYAKFPASMVNFFSGIKVAATYSIMGAVIGEWLGGSEGLGVYMMRVKHSYALDKVFAVILIIVILSMSLFKIISILQNLIMPWQNDLNKRR